MCMHFSNACKKSCNSICYKNYTLNYTHVGGVTTYTHVRALGWMYRHLIATVCLSYDNFRCIQFRLFCLNVGVPVSAHKCVIILIPIPTHLVGKSYMHFLHLECILGKSDWFISSGFNATCIVCLFLCVCLSVVVGSLAYPCAFAISSTK